MKNLMLSTAVLTATTFAAMAQDTTAPVVTPDATTEVAPEMTTEGPAMVETYAPVDTAALTAEELTGTRVYDANDEWIGEVSELVLTEDGKISNAVVDVGGFLGIGEKPVALQLTEMDITRDSDGDNLRIEVAMTKEQLEALPQYEG